MSETRRITGVHSECGQLNTVLVHYPARALSYLTPDNADELLFDDVLHVRKGQEHHDHFAQTLRNEGVEVLLLTTLLAETLEVPEAKQYLLDARISDYRFGPTLAGDLRGFFAELPNQLMAEILTGGFTFGELPEFIKNKVNMVLGVKAPTDFVIPGVPNTLFTRDASAWVYNGVTVNPMAKPARQPETALMRAIYKWHPRFVAADFNWHYGLEDINYEGATIEGGDVLVIGRGAVLIGVSERTTPQGVELLARGLFASGQATRVIAVELPKCRAAMHLDTVFTHVDIDKFNIYQPAFGTATKCWSLYPGKGDGLKIVEESHFLTAVEDALGLDYLHLITPDCDAYQLDREQWNDGANTMAVRPGVVVGYKGNDYYNEALDKAGVAVLPIDGSELGRGRGGSRCMTCPISRVGI